MTPLTSRLRASAQAMRTLDAVSLRPSSLALIDRVQAGRIARELEEAAGALEVQPVAWRVRGYAQFKTGKPGPWRYFDGTAKPNVNTPDCCDFELLYTAPTAQVALEVQQKGTAGVAPAAPECDSNGTVQCQELPNSHRCAACPLKLGGENCAPGVTTGGGTDADH